MAATLSATIDATQQRIVSTEPVEAVPGDLLHASGTAILRVADALVSDVTPPDPFPSGGGGVTPDQQAALDAADPPLTGSNPVAGVAGTMRLIGPFSVTSADTGIDSAPGVLLTTLPAGTYVERIQVLLSHRFDAAIWGELRWYLIGHGDWWRAGYADLGPNNTGEDSVGEGLTLEAFDVVSDDINRYGVPESNLLGAFLAVPWELRFMLTGSSAEGSADIYAIIATPAS